MIRLEPRTPFLESTPLESGSHEPVPAREPLPTRVDSDPTPSLDHNPDRLRLPDFPEYEFTKDGTPFRMFSVATRGPAPVLGRVSPDSNGRYALRNAKGKRELLSARRLVSLLNGERVVSTGRFTLDQFPRECFDMTGMAYGIRDGRPRKFQPYGSGDIPARRFRLFNAETGGHDWVTDIAIRRMRDGRSGRNFCLLPEGCAYLPSEFPDYCIDMLSGQPYRISSVRFCVTEPLKLAPHRTGQFALRDFSGKRRWFHPQQLVALVNPEPRTTETE